MPASRIELWVTYRNPDGSLGAPRPGAKAILRNYGRNTGSSGDQWPAVDLAQVVFTPKAFQSAGAIKFLAVRGQARGLLAEGGLLSSPAPRTEIAYVASLSAPSVNMPNLKLDATIPACKTLPSGHKRRIFFGSPAGHPDDFGMGYEEVDESGVPVPGTAQPIEAFNHARVNVCLPLGPGNSPVTETWQLVNTAS